MATIIPDFTVRPNRCRYPWEQWEDGHTYRAEKGTDFERTVHSFAACLRNRAYTFGLRVVVRTNEAAGTVEFRFSAKEPEVGHGKHRGVRKPRVHAG